MTEKAITIIKQVKKLRAVVLLGALLYLSAELNGASLPFDEDAVFCSYFKISGDKPAEEDIEELCYNTGKPAYSQFKPSEMFSRKTVIKERERLSAKINDMGADSVFVWKIKAAVTLEKHGNSIRDISCDFDNLPQPTPFINSQLSRSGIAKIKNELKGILKKNMKKIRGNEIDIAVYLKPEKAVYGYQKRYIVEEDVVLPIRYVIFQPVQVQILDVYDDIR